MEEYKTKKKKEKSREKRKEESQLADHWEKFI